MFGRDFFSNFDEDPFFRGHNEAMQRMRSNAFADPFFSQPQRSLMGPEMPRRRQDGDQRNNMMVAPPTDMFSHMNSMFADTNSMFQNMHNQMNSMANDPNSHSYSSSMVMSYSSNGNEPPKYYQATTSTKRAPGGIQESQRSYRDSESGIHKMAIEQSLGDRGHKYERTKNTRGGDIEENREFYNMDEEDAAHFDREWQRRAHNQHMAIGHPNRHRSRRHRNNDPQLMLSDRHQPRH